MVDGSVHVFQSPNQQRQGQQSPNQETTDQKPNVLLQSSLRELKDNYYQIEGQIQIETQKQRDTQKERYSQVLDKIQSLKKILKIEVEQRKNAESHFKEEISTQQNAILSRFSAQYLNKLREMQEQIEGFSHRRKKLDLNMGQLGRQIDSRMSDQKEKIINRISDKRDQFEKAYEMQVDTDIKQLKGIGELQYNYKQITAKVHHNRQQEFTQIDSQIQETLRSNEVYQQEEACRKMLLQQINTLKNQCKVEIEQRKIADEEIQNALTQYQTIIENEVAKQRATLTSQNQR